MAKNILILTGSPRKNGNSQQLAEAFAKGAVKAGHNVEIFATASKNIKGCVACDACFKKDKACVFNDDFNQLAPLAQKADVLVLATPLYWFTFPTQLKAAIDKFYAFMVGNINIENKQCVLLASAGDEQMQAYDGLQKTYDLILDFLKWHDAGRLLLTGLNEKTDVTAAQLQKAENMGAAI